MALDVNTFPLVISVQEDGQLVGTISGIETLMTGAADRAGRAFQRAGATANSSFKFDQARRDVDLFAKSIAAFQTRAAQRGADPLGIKASIDALASNPFQRVLQQQIGAENALEQQRARAQADRIAGIEREFNAAIRAIDARKAAQAAAFKQAEAEGLALVALENQRAQAAAALVAAPSQAPSTLFFDPKGAQAAAAAARLQANALEEVASAARVASAATATATESDRAFATAARDAATAANLEANRLEALAATQGRVAAAAIAANSSFEATNAAVQNSVRGTRFATLQASQQFQDFFIQLQGGQNPLVAFSQQASQLAFVMAQTGGETGKFAAFMAGPWGTAIFAGLSVLTLLTAGLFDEAKAADKAKNASLSLEDALTKQKFATDEARKAIDEYNVAQKKAEATDSLAAESALRVAKGRLQEAIATRLALQATIEKLNADEASARFVGGGQILPAIDQASNVLTANAGTIGTLQQTIRNLNIEVATNTSKGVADASKRINDFYDRLADKAKRAARGNNELNASIGATLNGIEKRRAAELDAESEKSRKGRSSNADANRQASQRRQELFADAAAIGDGTDAIKAANSAYSAEITRLKNQLREGLISDATAKDAAIKARAVRNAAIEAAQGAKTLEEALQRIGQEFDGESNFVDRIQKARIAIEQARGAIGALGTGTIGETVFDTAQLDKFAAGVEAAYVRPISDANRSLQDQLAIQAQILAGNGPEAEFLQLKQQILQSYGTLTDDERAKIEALIDPLRGVLDLERQRSLEIERRNSLIDVQVRAAQQLQSAFTDLLSDPFGKDGVKNFTNSITQIRKRALGEELSIKLLGDLGQKKRDELNGFAPLNVSADKLTTAGTNLTDAATRMVDIFRGAFVARGPTAAQLATTPTAFTSAAINALFREGPGITGELAPRANDPDIIVEGVRQIARSSSKQADAASDAKDAATTRQRGDFRNSAALTLLASAVGGKGGAFISAFQNTKTFSDIGKTISKEIGGTLGKTLGGAANGLGIGQAVGSGLDLVGLKGGGTGSSIGGLIGGAALGPLGAIGGALLGGIVGSLFFKAPKASAGISVDSSGGISSSGVTGTSGQLKQQASALGDSVASGLSTIASTLGGLITGQSDVKIGTFKGAFRVNTTGGAVGGVKGSGAVDFGEDQKGAIAFAIQDALKDGVITGIRNSTKALLTAGKDLDRQLQKAVSFENVFIQLKQFRDPVGAASDALEKEFANLRSIFKEAGATAEEYADLEALYVVKREDTLKQARQNLTGQLQSLLDDLRFKGDSGLSLRTREANASAAFTPLAQQIRSGQRVDQDKFNEAARAYIDISRQIYGSTTTYFDRLADVTGLTAQAIGNATNVISIGSQFSGINETRVANDNEVLAQSLAQALATPIGGLAIPQDRVAQFTDNQLQDAIIRSIQTANGVAGFTGQSNADLISVINRQTDVIAAQTAQLSSRFDLLISTTDSLQLSQPGNTVPSAFDNNFTLRNA